METCEKTERETITDRFVFSKVFLALKSLNNSRTLVVTPWHLCAGSMVCCLLFFYFVNHAKCDTLCSVKNTLYCAHKLQEFRCGVFSGLNSTVCWYTTLREPLPKIPSFCQTWSSEYLCNRNFQYSFCTFVLFYCSPRCLKINVPWMIYQCSCTHFVHKHTCHDRSCLLLATGQQIFQLWCVSFCSCRGHTQTEVRPKHSSRLVHCGAVSIVTGLSRAWSITLNSNVPTPCNICWAL